MGTIKLVLIALYVTLTAGGLIVLKLGSNSGPFLSLMNNRPVLNLTLLNIIGILMYGLSFLLYTFLVAKNDLAFIIPVTTGVVYVLIFIASYFLFKEGFTALKIAAIILILSGVIILSLEK